MATDPPATSADRVCDGRLGDETIWVHFDRPDQATLQPIGRRLGVHPDHLALCVAASASPRVDDHGRYLFVTLHLPVFSPESPANTVTTLSAIVADRELCTVQFGPGSALTRLYRECQDDASRRRELYSGGPSALLARLVAAWIAGGSSQLDALLDESREVADSILGRREDGSPEVARNPEVVASVARIRHAVTQARHVLGTQWPLLDSIAGMPARDGTCESARILWRSSASQMAALAGRVAALYDDTDGLMLAISALNSQQTSEHTRLVVLVVAAFLPIIAVFALFATSIRDLPFVAEPRGFETVLALALVIGLVCLYILRRRL